MPRSPLPLPAAWKLDLKEGAIAAILGCEEGTALRGWQSNKMERVWAPSALAQTSGCGSEGEISVLLMLLGLGVSLL